MLRLWESSPNDRSLFSYSASVNAEIGTSCWQCCSKEKLSSKHRCVTDRAWVVGGAQWHAGERWYLWTIKVRVQVQSTNGPLQTTSVLFWQRRSLRGNKKKRTQVSLLLFSPLEFRPFIVYILSSPLPLYSSSFIRLW